MPFTLSHPAAAVPLKRVLGRYSSVSALAAGSVTPDIPYFLPLAGADRGLAHDPLALLWFCLPAGLALWWLSRTLLAQPLLALAPEELRRRLAPGHTAARVPWMAAALSVLLGAATHLGWDSFTHAGSPLVENLPLLRIEIGRVGGDGLTLYRLIQHVSTILGLALVGWWSLRWLRAAKPGDAPGAAPWPGSTRGVVLAALAAVPMLWMFVAILHAVGIPDSFLRVRMSIGVAAVAAIRGTAAAILLWSLVWHARRRSLDHRLDRAGPSGE